MNYQQTIDWLFKQLPMYQRIGKVAYKANLDQIKLLDQHLGHPHHYFDTIHVAGTNGKGSTCHMIASVLQQAGYKVGLYTSPHLKDFRERIKINGEMITQAAVVDFVTQNQSFLTSYKFSFFEMTVALAFQYFKNQQVDIAIIETGLGGRLDSTNIIQPLLSVITSIDKDHTAILGNTLHKIASEKAGIIKPNTPVVIGERRNYLRLRFRESAQQINAAYHQVDHRATTLTTDLMGNYQKDNVRTATLSLEVLQNVYQYKYTPDQLAAGLNSVVANTGLMGRYQTIQHQPRIVADTAHNPAGIKALMQQLDKENYQQLYIVIGMVSDKAAQEVLTLLAKDAQYHIAAPQVPRAMPVDVLSTYLDRLKLTYTKHKSINQALKATRQIAQVNDLILVTGSVFVVAEIL